jgi:hypothetical protein
LNEFRRDFSWPSGVFGPVDFAAFNVLALIRASEVGMVGPFEVRRDGEAETGIQS